MPIPESQRHGSDPVDEGGADPTGSTPQRGSRYAVITAVVGLIASIVIAIPVLAEISPRAENTWGVYELATDTQTDAIKSHVWAIEQIGDRVYVGGKFLEARPNRDDPGVAQPYLAAFDVRTGDLIESFRPSLEGPVYSLQASPDGSRLFVGGEFRSINGDTEAHGLAALDPTTGAVDPTWRAKVTNTSGARPLVLGLTPHGGHLYLAGRFDQIGVGAGAHTTEKAGRVALSTGAPDTTLATDIDGSAVWGIAVAPDGSKIFLAGYHDAVDGDTRGADYAVLTPTGSLIPDWSDTGGNSANPARWYGQDIVVTDDLVFWAGSEHVVRAYSLTDGSLVSVNSTRRGGDYQDLEVVGDRVYASCHCYTDHAADFDAWGFWGRLPTDVVITPIKYVAAYSASTGTYIPDFQLDASAFRAGVWAIHGDSNGCLWVGGDLSRLTTVAGNDRPAGGFGKFCEGDGTDNQAPQPPPNLTQTRSEPAQIVLRWERADDNVDTTSYEIRRGGEVIGTKPDTGVNRYWFSDRTVEPATVYGYEIIAIDAAGNRSQPATIEAATVGAVPGGDTEAPGAPGALAPSRTEARKIVIRWTTATDNVGVTSYEVSRDGTAVGTKTAGAAGTYWFTDAGLTEGTSYGYSVVAIDAAGNRGPAATVAASTTGNAPDPGDPDDPGGGTEAPTPPSALTQTRSERAKIVIRWTASTDDRGVTSYEVSRDGTVVGTKDATRAGTYWFTDGGLSEGTTYRYSVVAVDGDGNRSGATAIDATTIGDQPIPQPPGGGGDDPAPTPPVPTGLRATLQTRERIVLNWTASAGAVGYAVERQSGGAWTEIATKNSTWYTDKGLTAGTAYSYRVVAIGADGGRSAAGQPLSVATQP
ncbi:MAG: fibronectin type III domain-containing protein [Actinomycetota bacterium]